MVTSKGTSGGGIDALRNHCSRESGNFQRGPILDEKQQCRKIKADPKNNPRDGPASETKQKEMVYRGIDEERRSEKDGTWVV